MSPPVLPSSPQLPFEQKPILARPALSLRVQRFVSPADYKRFKTENAAINAQLAQMRTQMRGFTLKSDSFSPRTEEQKKQADVYNRLKSSRHDLPDFYFRDISLSWWRLPGNETVLSLCAGENPSFVDAEQHGWEREQADATQIILKFLSPYELPQK